MLHKVDRVYFEASQLKKFDTQKLGFLTHKELQTHQKAQKAKIAESEKSRKNTGIKGDQLINNFGQFK